jgi:hypothetical protein
MISGSVSRFSILRKNEIRIKLPLLGIIIWGLSVLQALSSDLLVTSEFSSAETTIGREVTYMITIRKTDFLVKLSLESPERPELPKSSALKFGRFQTSEQYQSTEGDEPVGITLEFEAVANVEGRVIIPSFTMPYMGRNLLIPAASIRVRSPEFNLAEDEVKWMTLELADTPKTLKVGQRYKTSLNLYVFKDLRNITFTNPIPVGSDFSMDQIVPGPTERVVTRGLYRYSVFNWPLTYTAVRSGTISVGFKLTVNFRIPNDRLEFIRAARSNNTEGMARITELLQDSREESLTLFTDNLNLQVSTLPTPPNPAVFYNAIGKFDVAVSVDNSQMQVGHPSNLSIVINGEGNLGAIRAPEIQLDNRWRVFSPQVSFEDLDFLSYKGRKTYRYVIIPLSSDISEIPAIPYSFFDTESNQYITINSKPIQVTLKGESILRMEEQVQKLNPVEELDEAETSLTTSIFWEMGYESHLGSPYFLRASFYFLQGCLLLGFLGLVGWRWRTLKMEKDQEFAREQQIGRWIRKYMRLAHIASKEEDSEQFYESAFLTFCAVVAARNDHNVEAITVEDVLTRIRKLDLNENVKRVVESYLDRYEHHRFSGEIREDPPLANEYQRLKSILNKVESELNAKGMKK